MARAAPSPPKRGPESNQRAKQGAQDRGCRAVRVEVGVFSCRFTSHGLKAKQQALRRSGFEDEG